MAVGVDNEPSFAAGNAEELFGDYLAGAIAIGRTYESCGAIVATDLIQARTARGFGELPQIDTLERQPDLATNRLERLSQSVPSERLPQDDVGLDQSRHDASKVSGARKMALATSDERGIIE